MSIVFNKKGTVVFKQNTPAQSGAGKSDSYATLVTTDGRLRKNTSNRGLQAGEMGFDNSYSLIVRYQDAIFNAIRSDLKVDIDSVRYTIAGWELQNEKRFYIEFSLNRQDG